MLKHDIHSLLSRLRTDVRFYVIVELLSRALLVVAAFCWTSLALDYAFELRLSFRALILAATVAGLAGYGGRVLLSKLLCRLDARQLALSIESLVPSVADRLITALELEKGLSDGDGTFSSALAEEAIQSAGEAVKGIRPHQLLDGRRLVKLLGASVCGVLSLATFALLAPGPAGIWLARNVLLDPGTEWPHRTSLRIEGFVDGKALIARGDDFSVKVHADGEVPPKVQVRYRMRASRSKGRAYLVKVGEADFLHRFRGILEPVEFRVQGGDDYEGPFVIETVPAPAINELAISCRYPEYTGLKPEALAANALVYTFPFGTRVGLRGVCNKPLSAARWFTAEEERDLGLESPKVFSVSFDLQENLSLRIALRDLHGIDNDEAANLTFVAQPDRAPVVEAALHGIRQSITARALIPFRGSIKDEYGIASAEFRHHVGEGEEVAVPFSRPPNGAKEVPLREGFDVSPLQLSVGQKFAIKIAAEDGDALSGAKTGFSRLFSFEVVTPDQLLSQIATRELNLRRRFERALEEVKEARTDLEHVRKEHANPDADRAMLKLHSERVLLGSRKNLNEVAGVSRSFDEILMELQNNRISLESLLIRIEQGICIPLSDIVTNRFLELTDRVEALSSALDKREGVALASDEALASSGALVAKMEEVLAAMMKLESFNEAIELLRNVILLQEKVERVTRELRKKRIEELLK